MGCATSSSPTQEEATKTPAAVEVVREPAKVERQETPLMQEAQPAAPVRANVKRPQTEYADSDQPQTPMLEPGKLLLGEEGRAPVLVEDSQEEGATPDNEEDIGLFDAIELAGVQRRRLSVTPMHVGDVTPQVLHRRLQTMMDSNASLKDEPVPMAEGQADNNLFVAAISRQGFVPYNVEKTNQDRYIVQHTLQGNTDVSLFGVCDGHGKYGHHVSQYIKDNLGKFLEDTNELLVANPEQAIYQACERLNGVLKQSDISIAYSGSTLVFAVRVKKTYFIANVGDSRAVLCSIGEAKSDSSSSSKLLSVTDLSRDHKPELPGEKKRILASGGRVDTLPGPPDRYNGPMRVWMKDFQVPGLAMSRSIGDGVAASVGVSCIPEIKTIEMDEEKDAFMLLCSDGVFEFMSSEEAVSIIRQRKHQPLIEAVEELVDESSRRWQDHERVIDDITAVLVAFKAYKKE